MVGKGLRKRYIYNLHVYAKGMKAQVQNYLAQPTRQARSKHVSKTSPCYVHTSLAPRFHCVTWSKAWDIWSCDMTPYYDQVDLVYPQHPCVRTCMYRSHTWQCAIWISLGNRHRWNSKGIRSTCTACICTNLEKYIIYVQYRQPTLFNVPCNN